MQKEKQTRFTDLRIEAYALLETKNKLISKLQRIRFQATLISD